MAYEFALPDLGEGVAEAEIERWLVNQGDQITEDEPMVEVMTDKATVEIPAPASGIVGSIKVEAGSVVPVGTVLVVIEGTDGKHEARRPVTQQREDTESISPVEAARLGVSRMQHAQDSAGTGRIKATPLVRRIARELGVDLGSVTPSGKGGKVTEDDVRAAAGGQPAQTAATGGLPAGLTENTIRERTPITGVRRAIATHLTTAGSVPTVTVVEEVDLTAVQEHMQTTGSSWLAYLLAATCNTLEQYPQLNAIFQGDATSGEIISFTEIDLGIAVQTDEGLKVPVVRDAESLTLDAFETQVKSLATQAKEGTLSPESMRGGTFTVTSAGKFGGLFTTPLLNVPQVAILGLHRIEDRAMVVDGEVAVRRAANLSVTFDHRANDGLTVSAFLLDLIAALQDPASL